MTSLIPPEADFPLEIMRDIIMELAIDIGELQSKMHIIAKENATFKKSIQHLLATVTMIERDLNALHEQKK
jgi:hypothetical protein